MEELLYCASLTLQQFFIKPLYVIHMSRGAPRSVWKSGHPKRRIPLPSAGMASTVTSRFRVESTLNQTQRIWCPEHRVPGIRRGVLRQMPDPGISMG